MATGSQDDGAPRPAEVVLADLEVLLDELVRAVTEDRAAPPPEADTSRLVDVSSRLRVAGARIDAVRWSVLPRIDAAGLWSLTGARSFAVWLARTEDVQTVAARRDVRIARALRDHLPATLAAALDGALGVDKVRALVEVATTSTQRIDALGAPAADLGTADPADTADGSSGGGPDDGDLATDGPAPSEPTPSDPTSSDPTSHAPTADGPDPEGAAASTPTWEERLLDWSRENGPDRFRGLVRYFARHADPDADERGYFKTKDREHVGVAPTMGGYHLSGFLTEEHGQVLTAAMSSVMGAPAAGDDRSPGQRRAQALADLARVVLDNSHTGTGASVRPHLTVTVSWEQLKALTSAPAKGSGDGPAVRGLREARHTDATDAIRATKATRYPKGSVGTPAIFTESGIPVPDALLRRITCDSEVTRVVFGPDSQVLDVGRSKRTVTGSMRRAVIARDKHCVAGGCDQPPSRCEVHHAVRHWADGGETSVYNSALLCWYHHDLVDAQQITMRYDGGWRFTDRNGREILQERDRAGPLGI